MRTSSLGRVLFPAHTWLAICLLSALGSISDAATKTPAMPVSVVFYGLAESRSESVLSSTVSSFSSSFYVFALVDTIASRGLPYRRLVAGSRQLADGGHRIHGHRSPTAVAAPVRQRQGHEGAVILDCQAIPRIRSGAQDAGFSTDAGGQYG